jgi:glutamate racemase
MSRMKTDPIGIFDSGVGGLSVLQHIKQLLPYENILYVADSAHSPYGGQTDQYVQTRSRIITEQLLAQGAKIIVIACNTATASIIEQFRQYYGVPFIGVEPGIKPALILSQNNNIGIMATVATLSSQRYQNLKQRFSQQIQLYEQPCSGLADQVEAGLLHSSHTNLLLTHYLSSLLSHQIDTLVLGCTHYSFLSKNIITIIQNFNQSVQLIDTSYAVAEQVCRILQTEELKNTSYNKGYIHYFTTGAIRQVQPIMTKLMQQKILVKPFFSFVN